MSDTLTWSEVRKNYPSRWVLVEALSSHSANNQRILDTLIVIDAFADSEPAFRQYLKLHREDHGRELYVLHTDKDELDITELKWAGIRAA